ncbi:MAG: shikimate kinase [Bacteroidia bacterium]|nr:MAG: shikimate kinase [Bacteroidia bacterium]
MRIFLVGFMGCGKSSLGKRLAKKLNYSFLDLDCRLEELIGMTVSDAFDTHGEEHFRQMEKKVLHETFGLRNTIIATGGGTPCYFDNMEQMKNNGVTVYLKMSPLSLSYRLRYASSNRPLVKDLTGSDLEQFVDQKLREREPVYAQSHVIIKGESAKPDQIISLLFG